MSLPTKGLPHGPYIVVANKNPELLDFMVSTLREKDYCVFQAYDGIAAHELTLALRIINLLITNTQMPGLRGPELVRQVRHEMPALPILYIKNQGHPDPRLSDRLPANVPTLTEPFTAEQLMTVVRRQVVDD